jgi:hypothetical protein
MTRHGRWFLAGLLGVAPGIAAEAGANASGRSAYETLIAPMFAARCVECHGVDKQKAKLALHTWDGLARGSDAGPVLVAGQPSESVLLQRLRLPIDDEEHMPPSDHPQPSADEVALLARWIEAGASRTATLAELGLPAPLARAAEELPTRLAAVARAARVAEPVWTFDPAAVAQARAPLAAKVRELQRRFPGALSYESRTAGALHFTAVGFGREFGDGEFEVLAALGDQLVSLDVSGTAITDRAAESLARFAQLRVLRAGSTEVGDAFARAAAGLPRLELLALPETRLTAASIAGFTRMRALRALRVAGTAAERPAQAANLPVVPSAADLYPATEASIRVP